MLAVKRASFELNKLTHTEKQNTGGKWGSKEEGYILNERVCSLEPNRVYYLEKQFQLYLAENFSDFDIVSRNILALKLNRRCCFIVKISQVGQSVCLTLLFVYFGGIMVMMVRRGGCFRGGKRNTKEQRPQIDRTTTRALTHAHALIG